MKGSVQRSLRAKLETGRHSCAACASLCYVLSSFRGRNAPILSLTVTQSKCLQVPFTALKSQYFPV